MSMLDGMKSIIKHHIKTHWRSLVFFFALIIAVQVLGNLVTMPNIPTWYKQLERPIWSPPNWVFGPVWTILYIIMAISGWRLWNSFPGSNSDRLKQPVIRFYFIQLFLNAIWSPLFFGLHMTKMSFIDLMLIIAFTTLTIYHAMKVNRAVALSFVPYLCWLTYAASLNGAIAYMN